MAHSTLPAGIVRFGAFEVDLTRGEMRKLGLRVRIQQQPLQVLSALLERPGEVVSREELVRRLWPEGTFVDFDRSLNAAVTRLRQTLSDSAEHPRYVETVARQGYRFVAPVEQAFNTTRAEFLPVSPEQRPRPDAAPLLAPATGRRIRRVVWLAAAVTLVSAAAIIMWRPGSRPQPAEPYVQLTDFVDAAVAPALSPDGRTVAFIRGAEWFLSPDQIWLMSLPDGEPVQLTNDIRLKFAPAFSPDGSLLAYSVVETSTTSWDTMVTPVLRGEPRLLLSNAEGLTWLGPRSWMFSEIKSGIHMAVVTASETRKPVRDVYVPTHERAMAHFSYASPDRQSVIVIEMDDSAGWEQCRLVPFDGNSAGRKVGPPGVCTAAGWSPDGEWMYFTVSDSTGQHLWRQRFPDGPPERITSGPAEAQGVAVAPDGRSVITSLGSRQSAIWISDPGGDHRLTSNGVAGSPKFSGDGKRVFYLLRRSAPDSQTELWAADLATGKSERLVSGRRITTFDVSPDGSEAVLAVAAAPAKSELWLAPLDGRSQPVRIASDGEDFPFFGAGGQILFLKSDGKANYLYRMNRDGSGRAKTVPYSVLSVVSASPDGQWVAGLVAVPNGQPATFAEMAIPVQGGPPKQICSGFCTAQWSPDMKHLYVTIRIRQDGQTIAIPIPEGKALPDLPSSGIRNVEEALGLPGALLIEQYQMAPGASPSVYAYVKTTMHRNLFRVPVL